MGDSSWTRFECFVAVALLVFVWISMTYIHTRTHIHTQIHIYTCTCLINVQICVHIHPQIHTRIHVYKHVSIRTCLTISIYIYIHTYIYSCVHPYVHTCSELYTLYLFMHTCMHAQIYIHKHVCIHVWKPSCMVDMYTNTCTPPPPPQKKSIPDFSLTCCNKTLNGGESWDGCHGERAIAARIFKRREPMAAVCEVPEEKLNKPKKIHIRYTNYILYTDLFFVYKYI